MPAAAPPLLVRLRTLLLRILRGLRRRAGALRRRVQARRDTPVAPSATAPPATQVAVRRRRVRATAPSQLRISGVLDTFSAASFGPDAQLDTSFGPEDWEAALESHAPHLLLVESAWQGNGGGWQYQVGSYSYPTSVGLPHLSALVERCRREGIATVFWNKEDPVHFDKFKAAATLFDVVLTTDADRIDAYRALPGLRADVVEALPFAAQPALHHPIGAPDPRSPHPVFAGTFYRNRHADRRVQLEMLLDAARSFDLVIFDRMGGEKSETAGFPDRFDPHVRGGLPYDEMVEAYRRYRVFLNTNSVTASPTMFSRRVFELLASGTPVISTPSVGMEEMLGSVVRTVRTRDEAEAALRELLTDDTAWCAASQAGLALVHAEHTVAHRLASLAQAAGIDVDPDVEHALTVLVTAADADLAAVAAAVPGAEVVRAEPSADPERWLAEQGTRVETRWVLVTDGSADDLAHLPALLTARRYAPAEAIGVATASDAGRQHRFVDVLRPTPALVRSRVTPAWRLDGSVESRRLAFREVGGRSFAASPGSPT